VYQQVTTGGADVNHRSAEDYTTAIFHAVNANRISVVQVLLEHGADPLSTRNEKNETMAEISRQNSNEKVANLLESWVKALPEDKHKICFLCFKYQAGAQKRCARCKSRWYCSPECQKTDWQEHKQNVRVMLQVSSSNRIAKRVPSFLLLSSLQTKIKMQFATLFVG